MGFNSGSGRHPTATLHGCELNTCIGKVVHSGLGVSEVVFLVRWEGGEGQELSALLSASFNCLALQYNYHQMSSFRLPHATCLHLGKGKEDGLALALPPHMQLACMYSGFKFLSSFELLEIAWTVGSSNAVDGGSGASCLPVWSCSHTQGRAECQT